MAETPKKYLSKYLKFKIFQTLLLLAKFNCFSFIYFVVTPQWPHHLGLLFLAAHKSCLVRGTLLLNARIQVSLSQANYLLMSSFLIFTRKFNFIDCICHLRKEDKINRKKWLVELIILVFQIKALIWYYVGRLFVFDRLPFVCFWLLTVYNSQSIWNHSINCKKHFFFH